MIADFGERRAKDAAPYEARSRICLGSPFGGAVERSETERVYLAETDPLRPSVRTGAPPPQGGGKKKVRVRTRHLPQRGRQVLRWVEAQRADTQVRPYCSACQRRISSRNAAPYRAALVSPTPLTSRKSSGVAGAFWAMSRKVALEKTT